MTARDPGNAATGRLIFANQLRAVAAVSVMLSHLVGVFWLIPGAVQSATLTPPQGGTPPWYLRFFLNIWWEAGPFGVALFFLISGFVIPLSLRNRGAGGFLAARLVRLWPTYAVALVIDVAVVSLAGRHWHRHYGMTAGPLLANLFLIWNYVGSFSIDLVNWSLGVETRFYLLAACIVAVAGRMGPRSVLGSAALIAAAELLWSRLGFSPTIAMTEALKEATYVEFMLLGCLVQAHFVGRLSTSRAVLAVGAAAVLSAVCWRYGPLTEFFPVVTASYAEALALFLFCYALRGAFRPVAWLDWLASVSYPVYLLQSILGYTVLKLLMISLRLGYTTSLIITIATILASAAIVHSFVEAPTMRLSHRLGRKSKSSSVLSFKKEHLPWLKRAQR